MKITPYQLAFLTFSYMLSGFFLGGVRNFAVVIVSFVALCLYAYVGYRGFSAERQGYFDFLRTLVPQKMEKLTILAFLVLAWIQLISTIVRLSESIRLVSNFLPLWFIGLTLTAAAIMVSGKGISVTGRLSELLSFLLIPLLVTRPFLGFSPSFREIPWNGQELIAFVSIAPIFYLLSKTVTAGDISASRSLKASRGDIEDRGKYVLAFLLIGGLAAVSVYGFVYLFEVKAGDVLFRIFVWWTAFVRLSVLVSIFADAAREMPFARRAME